MHAPAYMRCKDSSLRKREGDHRHVYLLCYAQQLDRFNCCVHLLDQDLITANIPHINCAQLPVLPYIFCGFCIAIHVCYLGREGGSEEEGEGEATLIIW